MNPATEVHKLWIQAMDEMDWDEKKEGHVLEVSVETRMSLQKENPFWWDSNCQYDVNSGSWMFRGCFKIIIIHEPLPDATYIGDAEITNETIPMFHHIALHVKRNNGRMRYLDWEGNDERML